MSFYTGSQSEVLFASVQASTNLFTFTTEDNLQKTLAPIIIPAGFFFNNAATGKTLKIKAAGQLGTTTTGPTFTWSIRLLTSTTWSAGGILLGSTAALTAGVSQTLVPWFMDVDVVMRNVNIGGTSVVATMGLVESFGLASPFGGSIPAANVSPQISTLDNSVTYYLFLSAACGTSNAANLINTQIIKVYGEN